MRPTLPLLAAALTSFVIADASAQGRQDAPLSPDLTRMLEAALASGNEAEVEVIAKYARSISPESTDAINALANRWKEERREEAVQRIRDATFWELVEGRIELGGFQTTGNTDNIGAHAILDVKREGLVWRHKLRGMIEYQESNGVPTREHYLFAYEPNYKISDRLYAYGAAQFESDRFFGYSSRYSTSLGIGYNAIRRPRLTLDLELGPAYRATDFTNSPDENNVAARGSLDLMWKATAGLTLTQNASAYLQSANSTVSSVSAINARLIGPLSGRFSYTVQYESDPPAGRQTTDTTSRASLVYQF